MENMKCGEAGRSRVWRREWEKFRDTVTKCTNNGREERKMNSGMKKLVGRWLKREELLRNGCREEIGLPMIDTGHRE